MRKILVVSLIISGLIVGCGKSQQEIKAEKEGVLAAEIKAKKAADLVKVLDAVKFDLKDGESARFRNVIGNCGEVNSKNSYGAYAGFSRFVYKRDSGKVIFDGDDSAFFNIIASTYCDKDYLQKFPIKKLVSELSVDAQPAEVTSDLEEAVIDEQ